MSKKIISILCLVICVFFVGCGTTSSAVKSDEIQYDTKFIRHRIDYTYSILEEIESGVCYLEKWYGGDSGYSHYGITIMLNPDGTPKIWED